MSRRTKARESNAPCLAEQLNLASASSSVEPTEQRSAITKVHFALRMGFRERETTATPIERLESSHPSATAAQSPELRPAQAVGARDYPFRAG
jgi:hypothetical protein